MTMILSSPSSVGMLIDSFMQSKGTTLASLPEHERTRIERELRAIQMVADAPRDTSAAAVASKEHTRKGIQKIAADALATAEAARVPHAAKVAQIEGDRLALRARATATPAGDGSLAELLAEREVRDQLRGKDPLEVFPVYLTALERQDWLTARAVENTPPSFPLLTREQREQGDFIKLQRSRYIEEVMKQDAIAYVYRSVLAAADEELAKVADDFGVKVE